MSEKGGTSDTFLPYGRQTIEADDIAATAEAVQAAYLTTGPAVDKFERAFAAATDAPQACACNSGTAALHLAMMALQIGPGDAVVVPSLTFLASANAARFVGAEVVFSDVDPDTALIGPEHVEAAVKRAAGQRIRAVMVVQLNGQSADMQAIGELARKHGIAIVEDACHALGADQHLANGRVAKVGACAQSDLACFSLHPVKAMTTAEGGMVTTRDEKLAERIRNLRSHGMVRHPAPVINRELAFDQDGNPNPWYYEMPEVGYNFRLPDLLCALGLSQLRKLDRFIARRRELAASYDELLRPLAPLIKRVPTVPWSSHAYHLYVVHIDFGRLKRSRAGVMSKLRQQGIGTQVHYLPVHRQPYYFDRYGSMKLEGADAYYERCLSLPMYPAMKDQDVVRVVDALASLA